MKRLQSVMYTLILLLGVLAFSSEALFAQYEQYDMAKPTLDSKPPSPEEVKANFRPDFTAQFADVGEKKLDFEIFGGLGGAMMAGKNYFQFAIQPKWYFFKAGIGLDISFNFDQYFRIRAEDWNSGYAWVQKFEFLKWGDKGNKPFYARWGTIYNYDLGNGTLVRKYSNMAFAPEIKMRGLIFDTDLHYGGFEFFTNDVAHFDLTGIRMFMRPLKIPMTGAYYVDGILSDLQVGVSIVGDHAADRVYTIDKDETSIEKHTFTHDLIYPNSKEGEGIHKLSGVSIDMNIPFVNIPHAIKSNFYIDWVRVQRLAGAWHFGFKGSVVPNKVNLEYRLEIYKAINPGYRAYFFDTTYDAYKTYRYSQAKTLGQALYRAAMERRTSSDEEVNPKAGWGWLIELRKTFEVGEERFVGLTFELNEDEVEAGVQPYPFGAHMRFGFFLIEAIPRVTAAFSVDQYGVKHFQEIFKERTRDEFETDTFLNIELTYRITDIFQLAILYTKGFRFLSTKVYENFEEMYQVTPEAMRSLKFQTRMYF